MVRWVIRVVTIILSLALILILANITLAFQGERNIGLNNLTSELFIGLSTSSPSELFIGGPETSGPETIGIVFPGVLSVIGISALLVFLVIMAAGLSQIFPLGRKIYSITRGNRW